MVCLGFLGLCVSGSLGLWVFGSGFLGFYVSGSLSLCVSGFQDLRVSGSPGFLVSVFCGLSRSMELWVSGSLCFYRHHHLGQPNNTTKLTEQYQSALEGCVNGQ